MVTYSTKACEYFRAGFNCSQSVLLAFSDVINLDRDTILKLSSSFGGGMGRLREVCGAVSSMFIIAGILKGYTSPSNDEIKSKHYELIQDLAGRFKSECGSYICRELLGLPPGAESPVPSLRNYEYYNTRPCENCIKTAAEIIEKHLLDKR